MSIKLGSKQPHNVEARMKGVKFSSYLLVGLFIMLLVS
jgi:hypothetical protein